VGKNKKRWGKFFSQKARPLIRIIKKNEVVMKTTVYNNALMRGGLKVPGTSLFGGAMSTSNQISKG